MTLKHALVIGLTGSFASGCSTLRDILKNGVKSGNGILKFTPFSLSDPVKEKWLEQNWSTLHSEKNLSDATKEEKEDTLKNHAPRYQLQNIGNELRKEKSNYGVLAELAIGKARTETCNKMDNIPLVFDSIRNTAEIECLKEEFPNFYLIAVDCGRDQRWGRVRKTYEDKKQNETDFDNDDERDGGEDTPYGQQVELCVDKADILIQNDNVDGETNPDKASIRKKMKKKIEEYMPLLSGNKWRTPYPDEFFMSLAYTASLNSECFKRQVGAVVVDKDENILSLGYNQNLHPLKPCVKEPGDCPRDRYKREYFQKLKESQTAICPRCRQPLDYTPEFKCKTENCGFKLDSHFIPDKALSRCIALHAEARALRALRTGEVREGSVLYTTASPCLLCAVEIANDGIQEVVYSEAYTDKKALAFLKKEHVNLRKFEGVKAQAYFKLFSPWRIEKEKEIATEIGEIESAESAD
jgi:dCMP deaminase